MADMVPQSSVTPTGIDIPTMVGNFNLISNQLASESAVGDGGASAAAGGIAAAATTEGNAQAQIDKIKSDAAVKQKQDDIATANSFGMLPGGSNDVITAMSHDILSAIPGLQAERANIAQRQGKNILNDPLGWLVNQVTLPGDIAAFNTKAGNVNSEFSTLQELQARTMAGFQQNASTDAAASDLLGAQQAIVDQARAKQMGQDAYLKAAGVAVEGASVRMRGTESQLQGMVALNSSISQQTRDKLALAMAPGEMAEQAAKLTATNLEINQMQNTQDGRNELQKDLMNVSATFGVPKMSVNEYLLQPQDARDAINRMIFSAREGNYGATPVTAVRNLDGMNIPPTVNSEENVTRNFIRDEGNKYVAGQGVNIKMQSPDQVVINSNKAVLSAFQSQSALIPAQGQLLSPPTIKSTLPLMAQDNNMVLQSLRPMALANPTTTMTPDIAMASALNLVTSQGYSVDQAAQNISSMYNAIMVDRNSSLKLSRYALPGLTNYTMSVNTGGGYGSTPIDLTNQSQVKAVLLKLIASQNNSYFNAVPGGMQP